MIIYLNFFTFIFALILNILSAQYTDDCYNNSTNINGNWNCFVLPNGCTNLNCQFIVKWKSQSTFVDFQLISFINYTSIRSSSQAFTALAFSNDKQMGNDSVCMCRTVNTALMAVETYFNDYKQNTDVLFGNDRSFGIFNISVKPVDSFLMCNFSRAKSIQNVDKFYNISNSYYLVVASGKTNSLGAPVWDFENTFSSLNPVSFQVFKLLTTSSLIINSTQTTTMDANSAYGDDIQILVKKIKTHSCLMVFAWMLIASTGILFSRYYKYILYSKVICYNRFWLTSHRTLMVITLLISIASFILILSATNWQWVSVTVAPMTYAHSVFGIITIALGITQTFIGFFYTCVPMSYSKRKIFHYTHRSVGASTYAFSIITIFLGVSIPEMMLGRVGWGITVGWTLWSLILPLIIEILTELIEACHKEKSFMIDLNDPKRDELIAYNLQSFRSKFNRIKSVLMVFHLFISVSLSVALVVVISLIGTVDFTNI